MKMNSKEFYLLSLGCSKNTVDSESMAALLNRDGYQGVGRPHEAAILIVNTCGFIASAREESVVALRELAQEQRAKPTVDCGRLSFPAGRPGTWSGKFPGLTASSAHDGGWTLFRSYGSCARGNTRTRYIICRKMPKRWARTNRAFFV